MRRGKKSPRPAQPHRKAKIRRRQPLSPSLLQPRDPCRPPEAAQFSESPRKRSPRSCAPAAKQKETCKNGLCQAEDRKKERMQQNFLPPPSHPGLLGKELNPQTNQPAQFRRGLSPTLSWGQSFTRELRGLACKDEGCRSRGHSPPDPTPLSLTTCSGWGEAGWPLSPPAPPLG